MNKHFKAWRKALEGWQAAGPIEFRRLARGTDDAFDFLTEDGIAVEVLGPLETQVGNVSGLAFLPEPKEGKPLAHLDFEPGSLSASHTINGHSVVLRLKFGNVRMLFAGDLNNAAEEALLAEHAAGRIDLESEVLKVPHHGSHEFAPGFLAAVSPVVSVVSSGDETSRTEFIHPRATLMNALGRHARGDFKWSPFSRWPAGSPLPPSRSPARSRHDRSSGSGEPPSGWSGSAPTASGSWCSPTPASETSKRHTATTFPRQGAQTVVVAPCLTTAAYTRSLDGGCGPGDSAALAAASVTLCTRPNTTPFAEIEDVSRPRQPRDPRRRHARPQARR
jgi:hypothetical protein